MYLPKERFGTATPGQTVQVRMDTYPNRTCSGTVLRLADEAEFKLCGYFVLAELPVRKMNSGAYRFQSHGLAPTQPTISTPSVEAQRAWIS